MAETTAPRSRLEQILHEEGRYKVWLATQTGIHASRLTYIIGGFIPSEDEQKRIAEALGREIGDVFGPVVGQVA